MRGNSFMYTVRIMNEYLHGPIWVYNSDGIAVWKYPLVNDDPVLSELNKQAMELFSGYYEFDTQGKSCWFNQAQEKADKEVMLSIIKRILVRLNEINDGSFVVDDLETERLNRLQMISGARKQYPCPGDVSLCTSSTLHKRTQNINLSNTKIWMKSAELVDTTGFTGFSPNLTQSSIRRTIPAAFILYLYPPVVNFVSNRIYYPQKIETYASGRNLENG